MKSNYVLQLDEKSFCPQCEKPVDLLCDNEGNVRKPWFYICWACKTVAQVGVGPVGREGETQEEESSKIDGCTCVRFYDGSPHHRGCLLYKEATK